MSPAMGKLLARFAELGIEVEDHRQEMGYMAARLDSGVTFTIWFEEGSIDRFDETAVSVPDSGAPFWYATVKATAAALERHAGSLS